MKAILTLFLTLLAYPLLAQEGFEFLGDFDPEQLANRTTEQYYDALGLDDAQAEAFFQAQYDFFVAVKETRNLTDRAQRFQAIQTARQTRDAALQQTLTEEQYQKFVALQEQQRERMRQRRQQGGGGWPGRGNG